MSASAWASQMLERLARATPSRVAKGLSYRAMRVLGRFDLVRDLGHHSPGSAPGAVSPLFPKVVVAEVAAALRRDGCAFGLDLPPDVVARIRAYANRTPCYGNGRHEWGFDVALRDEAEDVARTRFTLGSYFNSDDCADVAAIRRDPLLRAIARAYVGDQAQLVGSHLWWSFAAPPTDEGTLSAYAQMFHYDLDDYGFLKFFFYLSDVDTESGPHVFVKGSHRGKRVRDMFPLRRYSDREVEKRFGADNVLPIVGPAGSGFAADTFGIHKGAVPTRRPRLLLQLEYARRPYIVGSDVVERNKLVRLV